MEELLANADPESQWLYEMINYALLFSGLIVAVLFGLHDRFRRPNRWALTQSIIGRSWSVWQVSAVLGTLFGLYFLASFVGLFIYEDQIPVAQLCAAIVIDLILLLLIGSIAQQYQNKSTTGWSMGLDQPMKILLAPLFYLAAIPFLMLASQGFRLVLEWCFEAETGLQEIAEQVMIQELGWVELGAIGMAIFVAPLLEELLFRGILFPFLAKRAGTLNAALCTSIVFTMLHFHLPSAATLYLLSLVLCFAYWRTGSLWTSIGIHMIFNAITVLALNIVG